MSSRAQCSGDSQTSLMLVVMPDFELHFNSSVVCMAVTSAVRQTTELRKQINMLEICDLFSTRACPQGIFDKFFLSLI
jgi:hypothetical protein